jgi:excisionase family DNA binding protein
MNFCTNSPENTASALKPLWTDSKISVISRNRQQYIKLLEEGAIPHRKVGKHRRVRMEDVMAYKERVDRDREAILDQLAAQAQELDMGYSR